MIPLVQMLLTAGPTILRMLGNASGENVERPANVIANVIEETRGLSPAMVTARMGEALAALPPDQLIQLRSLEVKFAEIARDREVNQLQAETAQLTAAQETARVEAQSSDEYVRRTRPKLARHGAAAALAYGLVTGALFPLLGALARVPGLGLDGLGELPGPDPWVIGALFTPTAAYIGARTADAFSRGGKT